MAVFLTDIYLIIICLTVTVGVGLISQMLKPRILGESEGDEYISLELFEKIKDNALLC